MNTAQTIQTVSAGQDAFITGVESNGKLFTFGTVEAYTSARNADLAKWGSPIPQTPVHEAVSKAKRLGHELAWATPESACIVDTKTYPNYYAARQARVDAALRLALGDLVELEGRAYRLTLANNRNVSLVPVAA